MRAHGLGLVALLLTTGCAHQGRLRPLPEAAQASSSAAAEAHGVRLVASGSSWKGVPWDIERHLDLVQVRLENHSGRTLSVQYELFELGSQEERQEALSPWDVRRIMSARLPAVLPPPDTYSPPLSARRAKLASMPARPDWAGGGVDMEILESLNTRPGRPPYRPPVCHSCSSVAAAGALPTQDMLRQAFREGPLEPERSREGYLYFSQALLAERQVTLQARLVDAHTGEDFGTLSIPFEVY